jgi:mannosyltransferase OCH1-like enzyme
MDYKIPKYYSNKNIFLIDNEFTTKLISDIRPQNIFIGDKRKQNSSAQSTTARPHTADTITTISYVVIIQYVEVNKCNIILRSLKEPDDSSENTYIEVTIYGDNGRDFIYRMGCDVDLSTGKKECVTTVPFELRKRIIKGKNTKIPQRIVQTSMSCVTISLELYSSCMTYIENNPEFDYYFYDDTDAHEFVRENFNGAIQEIYNRLIPGAFKSDFFRYLYLWKHGGYYFDCKSVCIKSIAEYVGQDDPIVLCKDRNYMTYYNAIMGTIAQNEFFAELIETLCNRVSALCRAKNVGERNRILGHFGVYGFTGPSLLYEIAQRSLVLPVLIFSAKTGCIHKIVYEDAYSNNTQKRKHIMLGCNPKLWQRERHESRVLILPFFESYYRDYKKIYGDTKSYKELYKTGNIVLYDNNVLN